MKVLILGAGMYVTGRATSEFGTILPSLAQTSRTLKIDEVIVAATSAANASVVNECCSFLNDRLGSSLSCSYITIDTAHMKMELTRLQDTYHFDCAIVATPDHTHHGILALLIRMKLPILVVKPFVTSLAEAKQLTALQRESPVYGAVEFHKRYDESNLYAKRVIREGSLGDLLYVTVDYSQRVTIPTEVFRGWAHRTNIFQYLAVHYVDLIYFMTGYRPVRLTAAATRRKLVNMGIDTPDSVHVMIEWESPDDDGRLISQINCNWIDPSTTSAMSDQKFKIVGSKGRLECDQKNRGIELVTEEHGVNHVNPYFSNYLYNADDEQVFSGYGFKSINQYLQDVHNLMNGSTTLEELNQNRPTFNEALISQAVLDTVNGALDNKLQWYDVPRVS